MRKKIETTFGVVTGERAALPYFALIAGLSYHEMLKTRLAVRQKCLDDVSYRNSILQICAADICFFAGMFAIFHETRRTEERQGAFHVHLDPDQADILACFQKYGGLQDIAVEKSRGIGLSYLLCVYVLWLWLFHPGGIECGLLSKDEDSLDVRDRPGSLLGKLDLLFAGLPAWMRLDPNGKSILKRTSTDHKFVNTKNNNSVLGFVSTDDKVRSARLYCLGADESAFLTANLQRWLASAHGTTPSIIYISTHDGTNTMFYRLTQNETADLIRITTWWYENRRCRKGLYMSVGGQIEIIDKDFKFPPDYEFSHAHAPLLRSPWMDRAFQRAEADPVTVLQEFYGVAVVNIKKLFQKTTMEAASQTLMGPVWRGTWVAEGEFIESFDDAPVHMFRPLQRLEGKFVIGADPSNGVPGGAFGGLAAVDVNSGEQVLSGLFEGCDAVMLAKLAVVLSKRLSSDTGRCKIVFESTGGVGAAFANELVRLRFPEPATIPLHNRDKGEAWLTEMGRAIRSRDLVVRDRRVYDEFTHFSYDMNGKLSGYGGRVGHGDGSIALSLAWQHAAKFAQSEDAPSRYKQTVPAHPGEKEPKLLSQNESKRSWSNNFRTHDGLV